MFRVYDCKLNKWVQSNCYINQYEDLFSSKKKPFGMEKLSLMADSRYVWHNDIGYEDKNGQLIYEGDICNIETADKDVLCVVAYIPSYAAYMLASKNGDDINLYSFYEEAHDFIEVVGNCFESDYTELVESLEVVYAGAVEEEKENKTEEEAVDEAVEG